MSKKPKQAAIVVVDNSFDFGRQFSLRHAEWNDKTVTFWFDREKQYTGSRHTRGTQTFAIATKELWTEAAAINAMQEDVNKRARTLQQQLKERQPK